MKFFKLTLSVFAVLLFSFTSVSCAEKKSDKDSHKTEMKSSDKHEDSHEASMDHSKMDMQKSAKTDLIITSYLQLKNDLVVDDSKNAAKSSENLFKALKGFDISGFSKDDQKELTDIIEDAAEHAEHISDSPIDHQREHLVTLSVDLVDFIAIAGSEKKLYQDHCPMANDNKGAVWLSEVKEIKNPYLGSKMPTCGSIQKEI